MLPSTRFSKSVNEEEVIESSKGWIPVKQQAVQDGHCEHSEIELIRETSILPRITFCICKINVCSCVVAANNSNVTNMHPVINELLSCDYSLSVYKVSWM